MPRIFFFYFDLTQYTKFNLFKSMRWFINLNGRVKAMKLLGENIGENLSDLE